MPPYETREMDKETLIKREKKKRVQIPRGSDTVKDVIGCDCELS